ncbi:MAG: U32 family peptidase, partial [Clostridia bacterium]|nr:U32 family peptidase [Clostridia bacterium]
LAPAGSLSRFYTALHFGADAVYLGGKRFGLRAYADNFDIEQINEAVSYAHTLGKKVYVTVNIFPKNKDFGELKEYLSELERIKADGVIVSDPGLTELCLTSYSKLDVHLSTQANTLNKYAAAFWVKQGVKRIVLAREMSLDDIKETADYLGGSAELEAFIHGAMCISYSGRCLLSSYLTDRDSNRGECVQACRWEYSLGEASRERKLTIQEDSHGSYILNSADMNTMPILDKIIGAGVKSLKIEGRMKTEYYVGVIVNAYRRRIDDILAGRSYDEKWYRETLSVGHRDYTTGFYMGDPKQCYASSHPENPYAFTAQVIGYDEAKGGVWVEQRNRFFAGDKLEFVSAKAGVGVFTPLAIEDEDGNEIKDCKLVQQKLLLKTDVKLEKYDMIRKGDLYAK